MCVCKGGGRLKTPPTSSPPAPFLTTHPHVSLFTSDIFNEYLPIAAMKAVSLSLTAIMAKKTKHIRQPQQKLSSRTNAAYIYQILCSEWCTKGYWPRGGRCVGWGGISACVTKIRPLSWVEESSTWTIIFILFCLVLPLPTLALGQWGQIWINWFCRRQSC